MIEIRGLVKSFGHKAVLKGIDLEVADGQFLTLVGPNGAGKTTLIRILANLSKATSGTVTMDGFNPADDSVDIRRHTGLVSHQTLLYGDLTPDENLRFYGRMYDVPDLEDRIGAMLRRVGLEGRRHDPVRTFSRGMQQRLASLGPSCTGLRSCCWTSQTRAWTSTLLRCCTNCWQPSARKVVRC